MGWILGRHCFYAFSGDFSSLLSLTHLVSLVLTGYGIITKYPVSNQPFEKLWVIYISSFFFIVSLLCTRKFSEPVGKPTVFTYALIPLISLSLGSIITQSYFHNSLQGLSLHLVLISFSLTGFPLSMIFISVLLGISLGIAGHLHVSESYSLNLVLLDLALLVWQAVGGVLMYKRFEYLAKMIVSAKKKPLACIGNYNLVENIEDQLLSLLDREEIVDLYTKSYVHQRSLNRMKSGNVLFSPGTNRSAQTVRSLSSRMDPRLVETVITNRSFKGSISFISTFTAPHIQKSVMDSSRASDSEEFGKDVDLYLAEYRRFELEVTNPSRRRVLSRLPLFVKKAIGFILVIVKRCYGMREMFLRATWANEDFLLPRNVLGMFSSSVFEDWYVEWMQEFNVNFYVDSVWILLLLCYHSTVSSMIGLLRHYLSTSIRITRGRYIFLIIRFTTHPTLITMVMLPIILDRLGKRRNKARCYYFLSLLLCLVQLIYSGFDVACILTWEHPGEKLYNFFSAEMLLMNTCVIVLSRYPTYFALFVTYSLSFITLHFILSSDTRIRIISAEFAPQLVTFIGSFFFYIRPLDISRRMIFCRYVLPYILYLKSVCQERQLKKNIK